MSFRDSISARWAGWLLVFMAAGALVASAWVSTPVAHADGLLSDTEFAYVQTYGSAAVCPTIDDYPTFAGVSGVMQGVMADGFTADESVDIINASVARFCPDHWALLQAIGRSAQGVSA